MRILLTGASGFVGSHILESLLERNLPTVVLLRATSNRRFLASHLDRVEARTGSLSDPASLETALAGITHVIHCAGCTHVRRNAEFYAANHLGTRNMVTAANARRQTLQRLIHISSLAVTGPATQAKPAREEDPLQPISEYGKSKLAGELEVRDHCQVPYTILRPPAVYGPRDDGFFSMFQAVKHHLAPRPNSQQVLSLVYVKDLAETVVTCLEHPAAVGKTYFVAETEVVTARALAEEIARQMNCWTVPCPVPAALLYVVCLCQQLWSQITGKPTLLNLQKFAELRAPGWVCDPARLRKELGFQCRTSLPQGIAATLAWYRREKWL